MAPTPRPPLISSVDLDLARTIAHHDAEIVNLGGRMSGVESGLKALDQNVQNGFTQISNQLSEMRGQRGPGFSDVMKAVASGGALIALSAGAITILVTSFVAPDMGHVKDVTAALAEDRKDREADERRELAQLREVRKDKIESQLRSLTESVEDLKQKFGWTARIEKGRGS